MATLTSPPSPQRTVVLKCDSLGETYIEGRVALTKTITPGMLIERIAQGDFPDRNWQPHSTSGGRAEKAVAMELGFLGDVRAGGPGGGGTIDDNYTAGQLVRIHLCQPGDELYMLLPASATAVTEASFLMSNGDGTVALVTSTNQALFKALESKDNSANGASTLRIRVRAL